MHGSAFYQIPSGVAEKFKSPEPPLDLKNHLGMTLYPGSPGSSDLQNCHSRPHPNPTTPSNNRSPVHSTGDPLAGTTLNETRQHARSSRVDDAVCRRARPVAVHGRPQCWFSKPASATPVLVTCAWRPVPEHLIPSATPFQPVPSWPVHSRLLSPRLLPSRLACRFNARSCNFG